VVREKRSRNIFEYSEKRKFVVVADVAVVVVTS